MEGPPAALAPAAAPQAGPPPHPAVEPAPKQPEPAASSASSSLPERIANWDPDLTGDPGRPAPIQPPPIDLDPARGFVPVAQSRPSAPQHTAPAAIAPPVDRPSPASVQPAPAAPVAPAPPVPTLAEAFSALLSAEQGHSLAPSSAAPTDAVVEDIVRRVILRMGDRAVRATVTEVAERLVREEIERIKSA
jgi:hypothetical protein